MPHTEDSTSTQVVMPVGDLHGRTVWTESGDRVGVVKGVRHDEDGRITSFDVRERWMLGKHHEVSAAGMRIDQGDVIVPTSAVDIDHEAVEEGRAVEQRRRTTSFAHAPVLLAGREGARGRFGGLDLVGSFFGALVTIAGLVLVGGVLAAIFGTQAGVIDSSLDNVDAITTEALIITGVTLFVACFLGGWAAGRSARFDGVGNGLMSVVWVLVIGVVLGALGAWLGDEYDVFANVDLPTIQTDEFAMWGSVALVAALVLMLFGGAIGGALGESWHRRADRAMLDVVAVDEGARNQAGIVGSPATAQPVDDSDAVPVDRSVRRPRS
jgi:hypothetical protein